MENTHRLNIDEHRIGLSLDDEGRWVVVIESESPFRQEKFPTKKEAVEFCLEYTNVLP